MSKARVRVRRPIIRAVDGLRHNRDRRKHIKQFHRVSRVTLQRG
jgi:hypothetical protein